jgi:hypothetical protein
MGGHRERKCLNCLSYHCKNYKSLISGVSANLCGNFPTFKLRYSALLRAPTTPCYPNFGITLLMRDTAFVISRIYTHSLF